jgi:hypothetical protein
VDLSLARGSLTIRGLVRMADGTPLPGARVVAEDQHVGTGGMILRLMTRGMARALGPMAPPSSQSDQNGRFSIDDLTPGKYLVRASFPGQPDVEAGVGAGGGEVMLPFEPGQTVGGRVVRADGSPVPDCELVIRPLGEQGSATGPAMLARLLGRSGAVVVHDPAGAFRVRGVGAGRYELRATDAAGEAGKLAITVARGQEQDGLRVVVGPGVALVGRVVDQAHQAPLAGATVALLTDGGMSFHAIDDNGQFQLEGLMPAEPLHLLIQRPGYLDDAREVQLPPALTSDLGTITLAPRPEARSSLE